MTGSGRFAVNITAALPLRLRDAWEKRIRMTRQVRRMQAARVAAVASDIDTRLAARTKPPFATTRNPPVAMTIATTKTPVGAWMAELNEIASDNDRIVRRGRDAGGEQ
jgi:hypothetical protein